MKYTVTVDVSAVYELLGSFMIYVTRKWTDNLDTGSALLTELDARLPEPVRVKFTEAREWPFLDYDILYALAIIRKPDTSATEFIDWMKTALPEELHAELLPFMPVISLEDVRRVTADYAPLLQLWQKHYFAEVELRINPLIIEDAREKRILLDKMDPDALVEYATGGVVLDDLPVSSVVLLPGVHFRPLNTYCFYDQVLLIQYPVDLPEEHEDDPPVVLLRMTEALVDPQRLRLLRYLADRPKTVHEIAVELNQPYDKLMHHLVILRAAGLLRSHVRAGDHNERFSLRPDGPSELQMFLESYIRLS